MEASSFLIENCGIMILPLAADSDRGMDLFEEDMRVSPVRLASCSASVSSDMVA